MYKYKLKKEHYSQLFPKTPCTREKLDKSDLYSDLFLVSCGCDNYGDGCRILTALKRFKYAISPIPLGKIDVGGFMLPVEVFEEINT